MNSLILGLLIIIVVAIHKTMSLGCNSDDKAMVKIASIFLQCYSNK